MERLLTKKDVCAKLKIGETLLWQLRKEGRIPEPEISLNGAARNLRWRESTIDEWIRTQAEKR